MWIIILNTFIILGSLLTIIRNIIDIQMTARVYENNKYTFNRIDNRNLHYNNFFRKSLKLLIIILNIRIYILTIGMRDTSNNLN